MALQARLVRAMILALLFTGVSSGWHVPGALAAPPPQGEAPVAAVADQPAVQAPNVPSLTLAEARVIIEAAMAYARSLNNTISVAVIDAGGALISQDRMDGGSLLGVRGAPGKAMAALILRRPTAEIVEWVQTEPDRYFALMTSFPGQVYLTPGGVPLRVNGVVVGAVGVSGLPRGVDDEAIEAGIAAWMQMRPGAGH